jgi:hypothetical protein
MIPRFAFAKSAPRTWKNFTQKIHQPPGKKHIASMGEITARKGRAAMKTNQDEFCRTVHVTAKSGEFEADVMCVFSRTFGHSFRWEFTEGFMQSARCRSHGTPVSLDMIPIDGQDDLIRLARGLAEGKMGAI